MFHSSACVVDGNAYLFLGKHGAGKSTALKRFSGNATLLNDDKNIVSINGNIPEVCAINPKRNGIKEWFTLGEEKYKIKCFFHIRKEYEKPSYIEKINDSDIIWKLLFTSSGLVLTDKKMYKEAFKIIDSLICSSHFYSFYHNLSDSDSDIIRVITNVY